MAPKKAVSPAKPRRITRARAADGDANSALDEPSIRKTKAASAAPTTTRTRAIEAKSRVTKTEPSLTRTTRGGKSNTRSSKSVDIDTEDEGEIAVAVPEPGTKTSRSTRSTQNPSVTATASSLASAPRRRIKVTPLDAVNSEPVAQAEPEVKSAKKTSTKTTKAKTAASKSTTSRRKKDAAATKLDEKNDEGVETEMADPEPKRPGGGRSTRAKAEGEPKATTKSSSTTSKSRGRSKKEGHAVEPTEEVKVAPVTTRQTRARAGSATSSVAAEPTVSVVVPPRKRVTFQDLTDDEDEKENQQPATISKSRTTKQTSAATKETETAAKGMRAKPIRRPAPTRITKATRGASNKSTMDSIKEADVEETGKVPPRALTPKKITQVAKAPVFDSSDDDDEKEEEDELAGAKTPIRDLSLSSKRRTSASVPRSVSPIKKLDFTPALTATCPEKTNEHGIIGVSSPPRRPPTSPFKDSLKESPRRAPDGVTVFKTQIQDSNNTGSLALNPPNSRALLLQSPKRGLADKTTFPPSAMKSHNSSLKPSSLSSPARRLFSPSRQKMPVRISPAPKKKHSIPASTPASERQSKSPGNVDLQMSSHFRSSVSPQRSARVYRMSDDELAQEVGEDLDFDQSVLNIRSPLKAPKVKPIVNDELDPVNIDPAADRGDDDELDDHDQERYLVQSSENALAEQSGQGGQDNEETMLDPEPEVEEVLEQEEVAEVEEESSRVPEPKSITPRVLERSSKKPRVSDALFSRLREIDDDSEDELAADQTPDMRMLKPKFRPSWSQANIRSRISTGVVPASTSKNLGFTPLAAQLKGWRAGSPEKKVGLKNMSESQGIFSPLAQMHIAGSVEVNRQDTPVRHTQKQKSLANRLSFAPSMIDSPARPEFFAESMAAQDFEDQVGSHEGVEPGEYEDLHDLIPKDGVERAASGTDTASGSEGRGDESESVHQEPVDLTTDLINFTNASNTAMIDFKALANEAEGLAAEEEQSMLSTPSEVYGDENTAPVEQTTEILHRRNGHEEVIEETIDKNVLINDPQNDDDREKNKQNAHSSREEADIVEEQAHETSIPSIEVNTSIPSTGDAERLGIDDAVEEIDFNVTPIRPDPSLPRYVSTVVSKVPLRPEGQIPSVLSPLKVQRKRPRSMSSSSSLALKKPNLGVSSNGFVSVAEPLATPKGREEFGFSPQRKIRSAAPSPAHSLSVNVTTPDRMSFVVDDFGDSTLDGIELPEDESMSDDITNNPSSDQETERLDHDESVLTIGSAFFKTPKIPAKSASMLSTVRSNEIATSPYAMSHGQATPKATPSRTAVSTSKTPATLMKSRTPYALHQSKTSAKTPLAGRAPLKPVGYGFLHGAVVHVDVHTSDGADASGCYVELLMEMGARCVKEWRWNPRASSSGNEPVSAEVPSTGVGVTHVVYKDGGRRTLEKVRAAKGQVLCVGLGWVLDCQREGKWLDESAYAVDASIMPRGGSRRRKSMEPRTLINENGFLSASRANRRSLSAEYAGLTEEMKMDLINTPVRGREDQIEDESEISSTYNSPTAATVGEGGQTADVGYLLSSAQAPDNDGDQDSSVIRHTHTPHINNNKMNSNQANPNTPPSTNLSVDYDPRTAATPLTPYLIAKGRELIQMSAPPKQINKGIFDRDDDGENENGGVAGGKRFQIKMNGNGKARVLGDAARRRTLGAGLGFKPVVGSPLRNE
ncbi:uncharacterized protein Z518_10635 [Rhinocladiella mackenziei CBS 650.93]|uniref:BRCT domain-containing protein n=1 Tax=Rhinocladiella mackenziei CBS 650.93 TaxID=1442369 RepID=A0A0D2IUW5_9EURO|nr:uncharacterized protein Z518_10635 [Rhinocladiella mackenziei CBS 650.93]KIX00495.1 hypothetical protein Z518_10635 [Rhinocladiella mackenziei CBS 650.93]